MALFWSNEMLPTILTLSLTQEILPLKWCELQIKGCVIYRPTSIQFSLNAKIDTPYIQNKHLWFDGRALKKWELTLTMTANQRRMKIKFKKNLRKKKNISLVKLNHQKPYLKKRFERETWKEVFVWKIWLVHNLTLICILKWPPLKIISKRLMKRQTGVVVVVQVETLIII